MIQTMNKAPTNNPADTAAQPRETTPEAVSAKPSASQVLIGVIKRLIGAGLERLAVLQADPTPEEVQDTGIAFGTFNLCVIFARIMRGLNLATALQKYIASQSRHIDNPPPLRTLPVRKHLPRPRRKPRLTEAADNATLLLRIPTEQEIAAMLRHRTIGAVLAQICADLGINVNHPMWQDVRYLIAIHGGHQPPVIARHFQRLETVREKVRTSIAPGWTFYRDPGPDPDFAGPPPDTTGPPPGTVAPEPNRTGPHRGGPAIRHARALTRPSPSAPRRSSPPFVSAR